MEPVEESKCYTLGITNMNFTSPFYIREQFYLMSSAMAALSVNTGQYPDKSFIAYTHIGLISAVQSEWKRDKSLVVILMADLTEN